MSLQLKAPGYSPKVAASKNVQTAAKIATSVLMASKAGSFISAHTPPDQVLAVQGLVAIATGAILESTLDYLKVRFPNALSWLR